MGSAPRVVSLHRYPIKSCRGIDLDAAVVERRGFALDRRFMVVDDDGVFRTQRKDPRLATVEVGVEDDATVWFATPELGEVQLALDESADGDQTDVRLWRHTGRYPDQGDVPAEFFSDLLGAPSRLVHMPDDATRRPNPKFGGTRDDRVSFADGYPLLLTSASSLDELQAHMEEPVPMDRFRANIVVEGAPAWAEDEWSEVRIGDVECTVAKACTRCVITTTDQRSGDRGEEPLRTLGARRRTRSGVTFGIYLIPRTIGARISLGDELVVTG